MMNNLKIFNHFILSKILLKFIAISICCFIFFNCIFSSLILNINSQDLSKISTIQKDVFSAIFFVSNTIERINFSLAQKIVPIQNQKQNDSKEQKKENPYNYSSFIVTSTQNNEENFKQVVNSYSPILNCKNEFVVNNNYKEFLMCQKFICVFLLMIMMFFSTIKKIYEDINNNKYMLKSPLFV